MTGQSGAAFPRRPCSVKEHPARSIRAIEAEQEAPRTPILALTANASTEDREACLSAGTDCFLVKPLDRERLSAALAGGSDAALAA